METKRTEHHQGPQGCSGSINCLFSLLLFFFIVDLQKLPTIGGIRMKSKVLLAVVMQKWTSEYCSDSGPLSFASRLLIELQ